MAKIQNNKQRVYGERYSRYAEYYWDFDWHCRWYGWRFLQRVFAGDFINFHLQYIEILNVFTNFQRVDDFSDQTPLIVKMKDLQKIFDYPGIDWIGLINAQLPEWLHRKANDSILIRSESLLKSRLRFLKEVDKRWENICFPIKLISIQTFRQLANIVFVEILYEYRNLFEVYPFNYKEFKTAIKTPQRFEICSGLVESLMSLPARALFARRYFPLHFKNTAEHLMESATHFLSEQFPETTKRLKFVAGVPSNALLDSFLDKVYENLTLNGNETLLVTFMKLSQFQRFLQLLELNNNELDTLKIVQQTGGNVFSCSVIKGKYLCKFDFVDLVCGNFSFCPYRLSHNRTSVSSLSSR